MTVTVIVLDIIFFENLFAIFFGSILQDAAENFKKKILELDRKSRESEKKISDLENDLNLITEENSCRLNQIETLKMELSKIDELAEIKEEGKKIVQEHEDLLKLLLTEAKKKAQTAAIRQLSVHIQNLKKYDNDLKEIMSRRRSCSKCCFC
jgi:chromosome segregation ATPase